MHQFRKYDNIFQYIDVGEKYQWQKCHPGKEVPKSDPKLRNLGELCQAKLFQFVASSLFKVFHNPCVQGRVIPESLHDTIVDSVFITVLVVVDFDFLEIIKNLFGGGQITTIPQLFKENVRIWLPSMFQVQVFLL